ncbi:hypothetical protein [Olsenella uli]
MRYTELLNGGATPTEIREFLVSAENVPVTLRIPETLRDSAKEAAALNGMNFTSFVKLCLIEKLTSVRNFES